MEIQIHMTNNESLILKPATEIYAYRSKNEFLDSGYLKMGYLIRIFEGNLGSSEISTSEKAVGILGLLADADYFQIGDVNSAYYKTSSIVSIY